MTEIAKDNNVSSDTIRANLLRVGITPWRARNKIRITGELFEKVRYLYVDENMSAYAISKIVNCGHMSIIKALQRNGITTRDISESQFNYLNKNIPPELSDPDFLNEKHWDEGLTCKEIGELIGCDGGTVRRHMKKLGLSPKTNSESKIGLMVGKNHPNWQGGITEIKALCREFCTVNITPSAAKRDNFTCQLCGETHCVLHGHHIVSFKTIVDTIILEHPEYNPDLPDDRIELYKIITTDDRFLDLDNIQTLCKDCHLFTVHGYIKRKDNQQPSST